MTDGWIVIPHWEEFQHPDAARSVVPPWIKVYTRLLHDDTYLSLSLAERGLVHGLWILYAASLRSPRADPVSLGRQLGCQIRRAQLERLSDAGLIQIVASKPASNHASRVASTEKRREEKKLKTPPASNQDRLERILNNARTVLHKTSIDNALSYVDNQPGLSVDQRLELEHHLRNGADG